MVSEAIHFLIQTEVFKVFLSFLIALLKWARALKSRQKSSGKECTGFDTLFGKVLIETLQENTTIMSAPNDHTQLSMPEKIELSRDTYKKWDL